ncbi:MAG: hypothetical protein V7607_2582 [Solirubrobacteraceae bacterium]
MRIRAARVPEAALLGDLVERAYSVYVERIGRRPAPMDDDYAAKVRRGQVFVADDDGVIVGLIVLIAGAQYLLIENVAVDPCRQGVGIGRTLLAHAEHYARDQRLSELRLYTNAAMAENLVLYPRLGYVEIDRRFADGFQRVFFSKRV